MIRLFTLLFICIGISGCATIEYYDYSPRIDAIARFPDSASDAISLAESLESCTPATASELSELNEQDETFPTLSEVCFVNYPKDLGRMGFQAVCVVRFDVSEGGSPVNVESVCNAIDAANLYTRDRSAIAKLMFETMAEDAIAQWKFVALEDEIEDASRRNILQTLVYADSLEDADIEQELEKIFEALASQERV